MTTSLFNNLFKKETWEVAADFDHIADPFGTPSSYHQPSLGERVGGSVLLALSILFVIPACFYLYWACKKVQHIETSPPDSTESRAQVIFDEVLQNQRVAVPIVAPKDPQRQIEEEIEVQKRLIADLNLQMNQQFQKISELDKKRGQLIANHTPSEKWKEAQTACDEARKVYNERLQNQSRGRNVEVDIDVFKIVPKAEEALTIIQELEIPELVQIKQELKNIDNLPLQLLREKEKLPILETKLQDYIDERNYLKQAQQIALQSKVLPFHPEAMITSIEKTLQSKSDQELVTHLEPYREQIETFCNTIQQDFARLHNCGGQDACNRHLVTTKNLLDKPDTLLAFYVLQELKRRNPSTPLPRGFIIQSHPYPITLTSMIAYTFKSPTCFLELEVLPPNNMNIKNYEKCKGYVERKQRLYLPKIEALQQVAQKIGASIQTSTRPTSYSSDMWHTMNDYKALTQCIEKIRKEDKINEALKNTGNWSPEHLLKESREGMAKLFQACSFKFELNQATAATLVKEIRIQQASLDEVVDQISRSAHLLDPKISHDFDRLHLIRALIDQEKFILIDGINYSFQEILDRIIEKFHQGITEENALAAEQFYVRTKVALDFVASLL